MVKKIKSLTVKLGRMPEELSNMPASWSCWCRRGSRLRQFMAFTINRNYSNMGVPISWLKAFMRRMYNDILSADVLQQLNAGTAPAEVKLDVSAPHLKSLLGRAFAKALSELPAEN